MYGTNKVPYLGGIVRIERNRKLLIGKEFETNNYGKCVVVDYRSNIDVTVKFIEYPYITRCRLGDLKLGKVKNPYHPIHYGKGYIGEGVYGKRDIKAYALWQKMLGRAYSEGYHNLRPTYRDVTVCDEWLNFQNFAKWFYSQKYSQAVDDKMRTYELDKDILSVGNKMYSPNTCCFVPREINTILVKRDKMRGEFPIGVGYHKEGKKFQARLSYFGKGVGLGLFKTPEEAFQAYKKAKESYIKEVAEIWKGRIDDRVYQALLNYEVHIDD